MNEPQKTEWITLYEVPVKEKVITFTGPKIINSRRLFQTDGKKIRTILV